VITGSEAHVGMQGMGGIGKSVLAAALARNRKVRESYPDGIAWISCGQHLADDDLVARQRDLEKISDRESINKQHQSIWRAMQASVEMLSEEEQRRFAELSVFATDQTIPEPAAATLWSHTGNLDDLDTEDLLINLAERSLVQLNQKLGAEGKATRRFRLHDLLSDYAVRIAGDAKAAHQILLDAYEVKCPKRWPSGPNDGYFLQNLVTHLLAADRLDAAVALVTDLLWVEAKCLVGLVFELQSDYRQVKEVMPEAQAELGEERARQERLTRCTSDLIAYSKGWRMNSG